jgi:hypothetical protein
MIPLLFYSNRCPHSKNLEAILRNTPGVEQALRFVCVDGQLDRLPAEIHSVPALLVQTSEGNKVVFETQMYEWLNSAFRLDQKQREARSAPGLPQVDRRQGREEPGALPDPFEVCFDAGMCDVELKGDDFASRLFAGAEEEIRIPYIEDGEAAAKPAAGGRDAQADEEVSRMMAARNQELSAVYSQMPRRVP